MRSALDKIYRHQRVPFLAHVLVVTRVRSSTLPHLFPDLNRYSAHFCMHLLQHHLPISGDNDSRKRHEKRLIFKIGTIHPLTNDFLSFNLIISLHSLYFCLARADKSVDFSPFHSIVHVHPRRTYSFRASASSTDRI